MTGLQARLRADLLTARKARDTTTTAVLRSTLAAVANAEALPVAEAALGVEGTAPGSASAEGPIAGAAVGLGATEAARRDLTDEDVRAIVSAERSERLSAATDLESRGATEQAQQLRSEAELLAAYL